MIRVWVQLSLYTRDVLFDRWLIDKNRKHSLSLDAIRDFGSLIRLIYKTISAYAVCLVWEINMKERKTQINDTTNKNV
jgi:hypothetical protein